MWTFGFGLRAAVVVVMFGCFLAGVRERTVSADAISFFLPVAGEASGRWGWDHFGTTGSSYAGPHAPDQFASGIGSSSLAVSPAGGLITASGNLYSFFTVPVWTFAMQGLSTSENYSSVVVQVALSEALPASSFTLAGEVPDEFLELGTLTSIGGFPYHFYWAEWQGLDAAASFQIRIGAAGQHSSLAGASAAWFNTSAPFDIRAVPEAISPLWLAGIGIGLGVCRRRHR